MLTHIGFHRDVQQHCVVRLPQQYLASSMMCIVSCFDLESHAEHSCAKKQGCTRKGIREIGNRFLHDTERARGLSLTPATYETI